MICHSITLSLKFQHLHDITGNPAREIRKRFDDELTALLLEFQWWNKSAEEINRLIPLLTSGDLDSVKAQIKKLLNP